MKKKFIEFMICTEFINQSNQMLLRSNQWRKRMRKNNGNNAN